MRGESITRVRVRYTTYTAALDQYANTIIIQSSERHRERAPAQHRTQNHPSWATQASHASGQSRKHYASITCYERARWVMCAIYAEPSPEPMRESRENRSCRSPPAMPPAMRGNLHRVSRRDRWRGRGLPQHRRPWWLLRNTRQSVSPSVVIQSVGPSFSPSVQDQEGESCAPWSSKRARFFAAQCWPVTDGGSPRLAAKDARTM